MNKIWLDNYQKGVVKDIDPTLYDSLSEMLLDACKKYADLPAFQSVGTTITFNHLELHSRYLAAYLQQLNLERGARVALILPNILQYPISLLAVLRAGMVVVNTNPMYTANELTHQLQDAQASVAIIFSQCIPTFQQVLPQLPALKHVIVADIGDEFPWLKRCFFNLIFKLKHSRYAHTIAHSVAFREAIRQGSHYHLQDASTQADDIALLQYTGGTTGVAKGAVLTHRNMVANVLQAAAWVAPVTMTHQDVIITALPLYHIFSFTANCLLFLHLGVRNLLIADPRRTKSLLKQIHQNPPTAITGVNTLFSSLLNHAQFNPADFYHLKIALSGGMALNQNVAERWKASIHQPIVEAYGLTEACPAVCINPLDRPHQGSIGLPLPSTEISIRDEQGRELPIDEVGELCIRGPQVMQGYWNNPKETALVFYADKFLRTGDSARIDTQGFVYLADRLKDLIIVSGFNVYPHEVEEVIAQMDKVLEVGVIGLPSKSGNERIKACIVARDPSLTVEEVLTHCRENLTSYKIPKVVEFYAELPKTNVGKILKRMLR